MPSLDFEDRTGRPFASATKLLAARSITSLAASEATQASYICQQLRVEEALQRDWIFSMELLACSELAMLRLGWLFSMEAAALCLR